MTNRTRHLAVVTGILIALAGTAVPALAVTSISCANPKITTPGNYQLTSNLACTVSISASDVSLALNGYTIAAPNNADGIDVNVGGAGRLNHVGIQGPGIIAGSGPANYGILIVGTDYSQISEVTIKGGFGVGISDFTGTGNTFLTVGSNLISGTSGPAAGGLGFGIFLNSGCKSCEVSWNDASGNPYGGIVLNGGSSNTVNNNTANGNGQGLAAGGFGIALAGETGSRVYGNVTNGNQGIGLVVNSTPAASIEVFSNVSSRANSLDDLYDASPTCNGDYWSGNVFQTANQSCIH